jgi:hypothetical protein
LNLLLLLLLLLTVEFGRFFVSGECKVKFTERGFSSDKARLSANAAVYYVVTVPLRSMSRTKRHPQSFGLDFGRIVAVSHDQKMSCEQTLLARIFPTDKL